MKYKAIIFDMDGTIIDTEHIWANANRTVLERRGIILTPENQEWLARELAGRGITQCCQFIKDTYQLQGDLAALVQEKSIYAKQLYEESIAFIEGFQEFHRSVLEHHLLTGLATNADDLTFHTARKKLALERFFGNHMYNISCVDNRYKPDPAIYLHASDALGVVPQECIAIEDSAAGVRAAQAAGMFCIGINTAKNPEQLQEAHHIVDRYEEINLKKLLELN